MLLELLSHQNFADMRYGSDPRFKFLVSRAVYKAILRFISYQYGRTCVVQPLPVEGFSATFTDCEDEVGCRHAVEDPLEASASPTGYVLYTRVGDGDFDNGVAVAGYDGRRTAAAGRDLQLPRHGDQHRRRELPEPDAFGGHGRRAGRGACWWSTVSTA